MPDWIWLQELLSVGSPETMVALFSTGPFHFGFSPLYVFTVCTTHCVGDNGRAFDKYSTETKSIDHRHPDRV